MILKLLAISLKANTLKWKQPAYLWRPRQVFSWWLIIYSFNLEALIRWEMVSQRQQKRLYLSSSCSGMDFNLERKTSAKDIYNLHITFLTLLEYNAAMFRSRCFLRHRESKINYVTPILRAWNSYETQMAHLYLILANDVFTDSVFPWAHLPK